jgi:hypothetical protein
MSREITIYPDPNYGLMTDAVGRELTVYPDANFGLITDAISREFAFWYHLDETAVKGAEDIPSVFTLRPPRPNPFSGTTEMVFGLPRPAEVSLALYDVAGRRVRAPMPGSMLKAGWHTITITAGTLPAGVYFYELNAGGITGKNKLVIR